MRFMLDIFVIMYYPYGMPSLITKWKKGNPYIYWVRSARVNGQPRIVEQRGKILVGESVWSPS